MTLNLRTDSIAPMLQFLCDLKSGCATASQIADILNHPDYDYEFRRYGAEKHPMVNYFMNLNNIPYSEIPVLRESRPTELKDKHHLWIAALDCPSSFDKLLCKVQSLISGDVLSEVSAMVLAGLPNDISVGVIDVVCTMSIGGSFGYVYDGAFHIDLLRLGIADDMLKGLPLLIAHEAHHVAMMKYESTYVNDFTLEQMFIHSFSCEGLAIKFCNNAEGNFSKSLYSHIPVNAGLDTFTMDYLNGKFEEALGVFENTLSGIRAGKISQDEFWTHYNDYWLNFHADGQQPDETPLLQHSLEYSFGNDLYGAIYDYFGKKTLFDCVRNPEKVLECFYAVSQKMFF